MKKSLLLLLLVTAVSCGIRTDPPEPFPTVNPHQHIIFYNGAIVTMDESEPQAEALEVTGQWNKLKMQLPLPWTDSQTACATALNITA